MIIRSNLIANNETDDDLGDNHSYVSTLVKVRQRRNAEGPGPGYP